LNASVSCGSLWTCLRRRAQHGPEEHPDNANTADTLGLGLSTTNRSQHRPRLPVHRAGKKEPDNALFNYHLGLALARAGPGRASKQQLDLVGGGLSRNFPDVRQTTAGSVRGEGVRLAHSGKTTPTKSRSCARPFLVSRGQSFMCEPNPAPQSACRPYKSESAFGGGHEHIRWRVKCPRGRSDDSGTSPKVLTVRAVCRVNAYSFFHLPFWARLQVEHGISC